MTMGNGSTPCNCGGPCCGGTAYPYPNFDASKATAPPYFDPAAAARLTNRTRIDAVQSSFGGAIRLGRPVGVSMGSTVGGRYLSQHMSGFLEDAKKQGEELYEDAKGAVADMALDAVGDQLETALDNLTKALGQDPKSKTGFRAYLRAAELLSVLSGLRAQKGIKAVTWKSYKPSRRKGPEDSDFRWTEGGNEERKGFKALIKDEKDTTKKAELAAIATAAAQGVERLITSQITRVSDVAARQAIFEGLLLASLSQFGDPLKMLPWDIRGGQPQIATIDYRPTAVFGGMIVPTQPTGDISPAPQGDLLQQFEESNARATQSSGFGAGKILTIGAIGLGAYFMLKG